MIELCGCVPSVVNNLRIDFFSISEVVVVGSMVAFIC